MYKYMLYFGNALNIILNTYIETEFSHLLIEIITYTKQAVVHLLQSLFPREHTLLRIVLATTTHLFMLIERYDSHIHNIFVLLRLKVNTIDILVGTIISIRLHSIQLDHAVLKFQFFIKRCKPNLFVYNYLSAFKFIY